MIKRTVWILCPLPLFAAVIVWWLVAYDGVESDILATLPKAQQSQLRQNADAHFSSEFSERVLVSVTGSQAKEAYDTLKGRLADSGWVADSVQRGNIQSLLDFYSPYRTAILDDQVASRLGDKQGILNNVLRKLSQPSNPFVSGSFTQDPTLNTAGFVEQRVTSASPFQLEHDRLYVDGQNGQRYYFIPLSLPPEFQRMSHAKGFYRQLKDHFAALKPQFPETHYHYSGIILHTAENALQAEHEMNLFGGLSLLGVILIISGAFRSLRPLMMVSTIIAYSALAGVAAVWLLFHQVHVLSLVFGITLIGIAIDYGVHRLVHSGLSSDTNTSVGKSITIGFMTTALGYSLFAFSPIGILSQVAAFVVTGLAVAWLLALKVLPWWVGDITISPSPLCVSAAHRWRSALLKGQRKIGWVAVGMAVVLVVMLVVRPITFNDRVALLNGSSPTLLHNESLHNQLIGDNEARRLMILGDDLQSVLETEERVNTWLLQQDSVLSVERISHWLPSLKSQNEHHERLTQAAQQGDFSLIEQHLGVSLTWPDQRLTFAALQRSPIAELADARVYRGPEGAASWMSVRRFSDIRSDALLRAFPERVQLYEKAQQLTDIMTSFRQQLVFTLVGVSAVALLLLALTIGVWAALRGALAITLTIGFAWWSCFLLQGSLSIFNVLAAMLLIALAVDYLVFYARHGASERNVIAITLSAVSSLFVFGMLAFSNTPAISAFGLTSAIGLLLIYGLSPMAMKGHHETQ